jgi:hypothetical protein
MLEEHILIRCYSSMLLWNICSICAICFLKDIKEKVTLVSAVLSSQVLRSRRIIFMPCNLNNLMNQTSHVLENIFGLMGTFYCFKRLENCLYIPNFVVIHIY